jgi:hypothetical protein
MSESLLKELRASKPAAPPALRERVRAVAATKPARRPFLARVEWRRLALVGAPATAVVVLAAAAVIGVSRDDVGAGDGDQAASFESASPQPNAAQAVPRNAYPALPEASGKTAQDSATAPGAAIAPDPGRVQRYQAELRLRVENLDELSGATQRAQRIVSALGGNVSSLSYDAPRGGIGSASIVVRVPVERVATAMTQLSQLGTILGQRFGIEDLQPAVDDYTRQVEQAQRRIAALRKQLANPDLAEEERAILRSRLSSERAELARLRAQLRATRAEGRFATIALALTTERIEAVTPSGESRLDGIKDVLVWEGIVALYALVIAGPLVLLGVLLWLALRLRRRREESRLLAQA